VSVIDRRRTTSTNSSILSVKACTLRPAASNIGRVRSIESDSMQTLSMNGNDELNSECWFEPICGLTNIVCFVKYDDRILTNLFGDLFSYFRVEEIMERVNND
jgi:hypothetical protein